MLVQESNFRSMFRYQIAGVPRANLNRLFLLEPAEDIFILVNLWKKPLIPTNRSSEL
jgi:hypothetical protein